MINVSRHRARSLAFQILYSVDVTGSKNLDMHFDHFEIPSEVRPWIEQIVLGTLEKKEEIDALLSRLAENWKLSRMALVDRNLLRLASYELMYSPETPTSVAIDEAIELSKEFGSAETGSFVNGVLDHVARQCRKIDAEPRVALLH